MTDKKDDKTNVVVGPWGETPVENNGEWIKEKYNKALDKNNTHKNYQEKLDKIEVITEKIMVQLIHTISEYNYDITDERFSLDIGFLSETVKGILSRQEKLPHIVQGLLDNIMTPDNKSDSSTDVYYSRFDAALLAELVEMAEEIKEEGTEIAFESDLDLETDPDKISEWKDDESKSSLHNMRTEKIHGKDDDEEKNDE